MYNASADFKTKIKQHERMFEYSGSIVTDNDTYDYVGGDIRSGKITRAISGDKLEIGTVYASELNIVLGLSISRYELYGAEIDLSIKLVGASDVIPMGTFTISEVTQTQDRLNIKAYDAMVKFEKVKFSPTSHTTIQSAYEWLVEACTACDVTLGSTESEILSLPNGARETGFADVVADADTWRDVLSYLGAYLGCYMYIGRDGKLYTGTYGSVAVDTVPSSFRYSSNLSDYRTTYDGIYNVYKDGGVQEYVANSNTGGIVLDLGTNPFLQFTDQNNRLSALQEIIDTWDGIYYAPYDSDMPLIPIYDPGDVLAFTGNQAEQYDIGAITEIVYVIGGQMHVTCSGDNPILASAQDRFTKTVAGLSADYNNGQQVGGKDFWILHSENTNSISVGSTKTQVSEIEWNQTVDVMRMGLMYTCELNVSATAVVALEINVDDDEDYTFEITEQKALLGKRQLNSTCGFDVLGKGLHTAKVYITVTDNALKWSELA